MKVYITKYCLTQGIFEDEVEIWSDISISMCKSIYNKYVYFHKPYWHETKEEAIKYAEQMKNRKIKSLEKQIRKLKELKF